MAYDETITEPGHARMSLTSFLALLAAVLFVILARATIRLWREQ